MSKRTQRRAEQRRLNRENREQNGAVMLAKQASTGRPETMLAQQAPTGSTETMLAQQAPTGSTETMLAQQAHTGRPETMLAKQAPTGSPETMLAQQARTGSPETKVPASQAQIAANRENATHSTGPTSEAGKAIVSQNRTIHGLNYNPETFRVLACEDQARYNALLQALRDEHRPQSTTETLLVTAVAQHRWLLDRANRLQESCFDQQTAEITDQKLFTLYLRYATTHERAFHKCLADLLKLRSTRQKIEFGFESEKRRVDRHRAFLDLEELNFILKEQKMLMAQSDLKPSAHPDMWPKRGQKAA